MFNTIRKWFGYNIPEIELTYKISNRRVEYNIQKSPCTIQISDPNNPYQASCVYLTCPSMMEFEIGDNYIDIWRNGFKIYSHKLCERYIADTFDIIKHHFQRFESDLPGVDHLMRFAFNDNINIYNAQIASIVIRTLDKMLINRSQTTGKFHTVAVVPIIVMPEGAEENGSCVM